MGKRKPYVVGERSGHRTILKISGDPKNHRLLLQCDCGSAPHSAWMSSFLSAPRCLACGAKTANRRADGREVKNNSLYKIWAGMKTRCNPLSNGRDAKRYAHKGIGTYIPVGPTQKSPTGSSQYENPVEASFSTRAWVGNANGRGSVRSSHSGYVGTRRQRPLRSPVVSDLAGLLDGSLAQHRAKGTTNACEVADIDRSLEGSVAAERAWVTTGEPLIGLKARDPNQVAPLNLVGSLTQGNKGLSRLRGDVERSIEAVDTGAIDAGAIANLNHLDVQRRAALVHQVFGSDNDESYGNDRKDGVRIAASHVIAPGEDCGVAA